MTLAGWLAVPDHAAVVCAGAAGSFFTALSWSIGNAVSTREVGRDVGAGTGARTDEGPDTSSGPSSLGGGGGI